MAGLILHAGGKLVDWQEVIDTPTPAPVGGHYPIPHAMVLEMAIEGLQAQGLHVAKSEHALAKEGDRYFGLLQLTNGSAHEDFGLIAAVRNTHDKSFAASLALGSHVFVCDNLAFSGEVTFARKHTRFAANDLPRLVADALGRLGTLKRSQEMRIDGYKHQELTDDNAYAAIVRASLAKIIPNARIKDVVEQWHDPVHEDFQPRTGWSLFNGFTEVLKATAIEQLSRRTQVLHGIMDVVEQWHDPVHEDFQPRTGWSLFNGFTEVLKATAIEQLSRRTQVLHGIMDVACGLDFKALAHVTVDSDDVGVN